MKHEAKPLQPRKSTRMFSDDVVREIIYDCLRDVDQKQILLKYGITRVQLIRQKYYYGYTVLREIKDQVFDMRELGMNSLKISEGLHISLKVTNKILSHDATFYRETSVRVKPKKMSKKTNTGTFLYLPLFNPYKAVEIAKKSVMTPQKAKDKDKDVPAPSRFVDVMIEVDHVRHEFTMKDFLTRLGIEKSDETPTA